MAEPADFLTELGIGASLGRGQQPDRVEAHKWFNIAATRGCPEAARLRAELAYEMTREEVAKAQRLAREYLAASLS
jgi:TPR repeat protein